VVVFAAQQASSALSLGPWFDLAQETASHNGIKLCLALVPDSLAPKFWFLKRKLFSAEQKEVKETAAPISVMQDIEFLKVESDENYAAQF
jgi:hypothetical protein